MQAKKPVGRSRSKVNKSKFVTRTGKVVKVNRSLTQKWVDSRIAKEQRSADRKTGLPKHRLKRFIYHFKPRRVVKYWFSRDGLIMGLKLFGIGVVVAAGLGVGALAYFRKDLPNIKDISGSNIGGSVRYFDKSGKTLLWEDYDAVKRIPVKDENISQFMKDAMVAIEDRDFFKHGGFNVRGILRASLNNATGSGGTQGGSTITQQLVKITQDWSKERTFSKKIKELILSVELERSYSKKEILVGYLNAAPFGGIEYGVEAAAQDYFQKSAKDLTIEEAAMLATIPRSPRYYSFYSPDFDKEEFLGRQRYVIDQMEAQGMITQTQKDAAKKVDILAEIKPRQPKYKDMKAPWFVLAAKNQLEHSKGESTVKRGGWTVTTTLDLGLQAIAEEQVAKGLNQIVRQGGDTAAFVAEDVKTGQVVAMVGGTDFNNEDHGKINYAQHNLPPGSSIKAYDYTAMIETGNNVGAGSVIYDTQGKIDDQNYPCTNKARPENNGNCIWNYDRRYVGPITLRYAIGGSRNVPAVKAMMTAGIDKTIGIAEKLMDPKDGSSGTGYKCYRDEELTKVGPCYAASAIGDGAYLHLDEHVHGYASISRNGINIPQSYILKITDSAGKTVDEWKQEAGEQVVRPDAAYIVADMISDPNPSYFPAGNKPQRFTNSQGTWKFGVKTGTTNDAKDGWMMGFSTQYAAGVWVGQHTRQVAMSGSMENMTQPIWQGWMRKVHENIKPEDREKPSGVQTLPAYVIRTHVAFGSIEPSPATDLFPSWYQAPVKTTGKSKTIDIVSNKIATDCTPERARKVVNDTEAATYSADKFVGQNVSTSERDDVHKCEDAKPSLDNLSIAGDKTISTVAHQGTHPLSSDNFKGTVNFLAGGQIIQTFQVDTDGQSVSFNASSLPEGTEVSANIVDSVLYDSSSPNHVTTPAKDSSLSIVTPADGAHIGAGNVTVSWSGGIAPYNVRIRVGGGSFANVGGCTPTNSNSCNVNLPGGTGTNYVVEVKSSGDNDTVSFVK